MGWRISKIRACLPALDHRRSRFLEISGDPNSERFRSGDRSCAIRCPSQKASRSQECKLIPCRSSPGAAFFCADNDPISKKWCHGLSATHDTEVCFMQTQLGVGSLEIDHLLSEVRIAVKMHVRHHGPPFYRVRCRYSGCRKNKYRN